MDSAKFSMRDVLKDKVSGFKGQVHGITYYSTGCIHYGLAPLKLNKEGLLLDWQWLDETRLMLVKKAGAVEVKPHSGPDMNPRCQ
jgi:hypothetical protein